MNKKFFFSPKFKFLKQPTAHTFNKMYSRKFRIIQYLSNGPYQTKKGVLNFEP